MMLKYDIERRAKQEGWNASLVRELAALYRLRITAQAAYGLPHPMAWDSEDRTENVIHIDVDYPHSHEGIAVPDTWLAYAVSCFRGNLDLSIALEEEISGTDGLHMQTSRGPDGGPDPSDDSYGITGPVVRFQRLMARLAAVDPEVAREQFRSWPTRDEYVFARLRIWAAGAGLLDGGAAGAVFRSLPDRAFWGSTHERDLLYALRDRWQDLSDNDRSVLEERLLRDSYPWDTAVIGREVELAAYDRLNRLHWLSNQGVTFNFDVGAAMDAQRLAAPQWTTQAGDRAADSNAPQVFSIERDTRSDPLDGSPSATFCADRRSFGKQTSRSGPSAIHSEAWPLRSPSELSPHSPVPPTPARHPDGPGPPSLGQRTGPRIRPAWSARSRRVCVPCRHRSSTRSPTRFLYGWRR